MTSVLPFVISGLVIGSLYALSGVGMLVLYRTTGVLNFAYGALGAAAGMVAWQLVQLLLQPPVALLLGVGVAAVLSLLFGVVAGPSLARRSELGKATATLGLALAVLGVLYAVWNDKARTLRLATDGVGLNVSGTRVTGTQVLSLALVAAVVAATSLFLRHSSMGTAMRALTSDRELAAMLGVRVRHVELTAWVTSGALAGVSGLLLAAQTQLEPGFLTFLVIPALATVVVGRFVSLTGTLVGGLLLGVGQALASYWPPTSSLASATPFVLAVAVILYLQRRKTVTIEVAR